MSGRIDKKTVMKGWQHLQRNVLATREKDDIHAEVAMEWDKDKPEVMRFFSMVTIGGKVIYRTPFPTFYEAVDAGCYIIDTIGRFRGFKSSILDGTYEFKWEPSYNCSLVMEPPFILRAEDSRCSVCWITPSTSCKWTTSDYLVTEGARVYTMEENKKRCEETFLEFVRGKYNEQES